MNKIEELLKNQPFDTNVSEFIEETNFEGISEYVNSKLIYTDDIVDLAFKKYNAELEAVDFVRTEIEKEFFSNVGLHDLADKKGLVDEDGSLDLIYNDDVKDLLKLCDSRSEVIESLRTKLIEQISKDVEQEYLYNDKFIKCRLAKITEELIEEKEVADILELSDKIEIEDLGGGIKRYCIGNEANGDPCNDYIAVVDAQLASGVDDDRLKELVNEGIEETLEYSQISR